VSGCLWLRRNERARRHRADRAALSEEGCPKRSAPEAALARLFSADPKRGSSEEGAGLSSAAGQGKMPSLNGIQREQEKCQKKGKDA